MTLYGITGGIGMGKSTIAEMFTRRGLPVCDTDVVARQVTEPGSVVLLEIRESFGSSVLHSNGEIDRTALAAIVFRDPSKRRRLEEILHPRIRRAWLEQVSLWRQEKRTAAAVVIPLLFETEAQAHFDRVVCVACSSASQMTRLQSRGWSAEHIEGRIAAQWPISRKMEAADKVIWTEGSLAVSSEQVDRVLGNDSV